MRPFLPLALAAFLAAGVAHAQIDGKDLQLDANGDLLPAPYSTAPDGALQIRPDPATAMDRAGPYELSVLLPRRPTLLDLPKAWGLLVAGNRDLVSMADPDFVFRHLRLDATPDAVIARIATAEDAEHGPARDYHSRLRFLAVRMAQEHGLTAALPALDALRGDDTEDLLLRWAAADAARSLGGEDAGAFEPPAPPPWSEVLQGVPRRFDALLVLDHRRIPCQLAARRLARRVAMEHIVSTIRAAGGNVTEPIEAGAHMVADAPTIGPFELARRLGNWRLDRSVIAISVRDGAAPWLWLRSVGHFDPDALAAGLQELGFVVRNKDHEGTATAEGAAPFTLAEHSGLEFSWGARWLEVSARDFPSAPTLPADELMTEGFDGRHAIWLHVPPPKAGSNAAASRWLSLGLDFPAGAAPRLSVEARRSPADDDPAPILAGAGHLVADVFGGPETLDQWLAGVLADAEPHHDPARWIWSAVVTDDDVARLVRLFEREARR